MRAAADLAHLLAILITASILAACPTPAAAQPPLDTLRDPGFEEGEGDTPSDAWQADPAIFALDPTQARTGGASLRIRNNDTDVYHLATQELPLVRGREYRLSAWIRTQDVTGDGATIAVEWLDEQGAWLGGTYPRGVTGTEGWTQVETDTFVLPPAADRVRAVCYLRRGSTGTAWFDDLELHRLTAPPLRSVLRRPAYRGRMSQGSGPIEVVVRVGPELADASIDALATVRSAAGDALATVRQPAAADEQVILTIPADDLPAGRHRLDVKLVPQAGGDPLHARSHLIHVDPPVAEPTVYIDDHRRLIVRGQPMLPLGLYARAGMPQKDLELVRGTSFNCLMPYGPPSRDLLDRAHDAGVYLFGSTKDFYYGAKYCPPQIQSIADEEPFVRAILRELRDHPALLAWYTNDELSPTFLPQLEAHYRWILEEDPNHPAWTVLMRPHQVGRYLDSFDAIGTDPYPIPGRAASLASDWAATTVDQVAGARPVWQVIQAFNWDNYSDPRPDGTPRRSPSEAELRSMIWQSLAQGANGIVLYSLFDMQRNPDVPFEDYWPIVCRVADEVAAWAPILLSIEPTPPVSVTLDPADPAWLSFRVQTWNGRTFIFAVNDGDAAGAATFQIDAPASHVRVMNDVDQTLPVRDGAWTDTFDPLTLRIYEIDGANAPLPPPQRVTP